VHTAILEPRRFLDNFIVAPKVDRRTTEGKMTWAAFQEEAAGRIVCTDEEAEVVAGVANAMLAHPLASTLLQGGIAEHSLYWVDEETGLECKTRPDYINEDQLIDAKTSMDASYRKFRSQIDNYEYFIQAAFQCEGFRAAFKKPVADYIWLAAETDDPYAIALYRADEGLLDLGDQEIRKGLRIIKRCKDADHWPSYQYDEEKDRFAVQDMGLAPWRLSNDAIARSML